MLTLFVLRLAMELKDKKNPKLGASLGRFRKILVSLKKKNTSLRQISILKFFTSCVYRLYIFYDRP